MAASLSPATPRVPQQLGRMSQAAPSRMGRATSKLNVSTLPPGVLASLDEKNNSTLSASSSVLSEPPEDPDTKITPPSIRVESAPDNPVKERAGE
jgi:hypothetical protein